VQKTLNKHKDDIDKGESPLYLPCGHDSEVNGCHDVELNECGRILFADKDV